MEIHRGSSYLPGVRRNNFVQHLCDLYGENSVLLPEIQDSNNLRPLILRTLHETLKRVLDIFLEPGREDIFLAAELMPTLSNDGVDNVEPRDLVFGLAFVDKLLNGVHYVLVELDSFHRALCDVRHLRFRNRRTGLVKCLKLQYSNEKRLSKRIFQFISPCRMPRASAWCLIRTV